MEVTTTKNCPECDKEIEIILFSRDPRFALDDSYQEPFWSPCCGANLEVEDIDEILEDFKQAHLDREADFNRDGEII